MCCHAVAMVLGSGMGITGNSMECRGNGMAQRLGLRERSEDTEGGGAEVGRWSGELVSRAAVFEGEAMSRAYGVGIAYRRHIDRPRRTVGGL